MNLKRHLINVHKCKYKRKSARRTRHDEGKSRKSTAAILSGIDLSKDDHKAIIESEQKEERKGQSVNETIALECTTPVLGDHDRGISEKITDNSQTGIPYNCGIDTQMINTDLVDEFAHNILNNVSDSQEVIMSIPLQNSSRQDSNKEYVNVETTHEETNVDSCKILITADSNIANISSSEDFDKLLLEKCAETLCILQNCVS